MLVFNLMNTPSPLYCEMMELTFPVEMANSEESLLLQSIAVIDDYKKITLK